MPSLFINSSAVARGLSPLMARTFLEPIPRSLMRWGYSWSTSGKLCLFSQKKVTSRSCVRMPTTSVVPSFATRTRCTPLPKTSMAFVRSAVSDSVISGSFLLPTSLTSLSGIGFPSRPFLASSSKEATSSSSGCARPTTRRRYALRSL